MTFLAGAAKGKRGPAHCRRRGVTIIEVAVVLLLLVVIVTVGLNYLVSLRESANRLACQENLRRIGEAMALYEGQMAFLPPSRLAYQYATWAVLISPYLSKKDPLADWDLRKRYYEQPAAVREKTLQIYFCASRPRESKLSTKGDVPSGPDEKHLPGAVGDYAAVAGDGAPEHPWTGTAANGPLIIGDVLEEKDGLVLRWQGRTTLASLKRGLSYTFLVGEKHVSPDGFGNADQGDGALYNGHHAANFSRPGGPNYPLGRPRDPFQENFGSYHPDLCQFLVADGSVRTWALSGSLQVLGEMCTREK